MHEINLFCFGFGQVAKKFIQKLLQNKIKVNLITTTRQKTSEVSYFDLKFKNFNVTEHNFDNDLPKEIKKFNHILVSTPPISQKDLFFELLNLNNQIISDAKWITYLSSTSVYGDHNGEWVDENSKLLPNTEKGKARLEVEKKWKELAKEYPVQIFRLAGIYSEENNLINRLKNKNIKIIRKKNHKFSRIHLEDISGFLYNSLSRFKPGEIYNIADDQPISNEEIIAEIAEKYSLSLPPTIDFEDLEISTLKDFYSSSKQVKNIKAKKYFNYKLIYPTLREGLNLL